MTAFLFDIDGVLTDLDKRQITKPALVNHITSALQAGDIVGLITGRAFSWIEERVLSVIDVKNDNLYVSGEFGGVFATYHKGKQKVHVNKELDLSSEFKKALEEVAKHYDEFVFVDHAKQTMFTVEASYKNPEEVYRAHKEEIAEDFRKVIKGHDELEVLVDLLGIPVKNKKANKRFATNQFLKWLSQKKVMPKQFYAFGDTVSDLEIGEELYANNLPVVFVFVGEKKLLHKVKVSFPVKKPKGRYDAGTVEFLKSLH
jgi:hydroxymethylpyrimidine pyrophosphatase-like HAD family hydrolase